MAEVEFRVLGVVEAGIAGKPVDLGPPRQRAVLAVLLAEVPRAVPSDQLIHRVWGDSPPEGGRQILSSYISRLRGALSGAAEIPRRHGGYLVDVDPASVDMHRYQQLVQQARAAAGDQAIASWQAAMALWRGEPFHDLDVPWLDRVADRLAAQHQAALADYRDLRLRQGEHAELIPELQAAADTHPLDERVAGQLMLALYRGGRQADALAHYDRLRRQLADELGSDPAPATRRLHHQILTADPELAAPPPVAGARGAREAPVTLPWDTTDFTGRRAELDQLHACAAAPQQPGTAAAMVISGGGGVGKTALALHWAHRPETAGRFPDGRLYVNLQGFSDREPVAGDDALAELLRQLGVPGATIPSGMDAKRQVYHRHLAGRSVLVILDNAAASDQVRPLLVGAPGLALVTSRNRLTGLAVQEGASEIALGRLPEDDASALAERLLDNEHHPAGTDRLSTICARLPLAIRLAATGFRATHPDASLASYLDQLEGDRIGLLDAVADDATAITNVLSRSVQQLAPELVGAYQLIGLHPGPRMDIPAIAALLGAAERQCRRVVRELAGASLLEETSPDRWSMHDLLAEYARDVRAPDRDAGAAYMRLLEHYLARLDTDPVDHQWINEERAALLACLSLPVAADAIQRYGLRLGDRLYKLDLYADSRQTYEFLRQRSSRDSLAYAQATFGIGRAAVWLSEPDAESYLDEAMRCFQPLEDVPGQARTLRELAELNRGRGLHQEDLDLRALELFRQAGDLDGESDTLMALALESSSRGDYPLARERALQALEVARRAGSAMRQGDCHRALGDVALRTGDHATATQRLTEAMRLFTEAGSQVGRGQALMGLGNVASAAGDHAGALAYQRQALTAVIAAGDPHSQAHVLLHLGKLALAMGEPGQAREHLTRALHVNRELGDRAGVAFDLMGLADVLLATGEAAAATEQYRQVAADLAELGYPKGEAEARLGLGRALAATGDQGHAREQLEAALGQFEKLGLPQATEAQATLRHLIPGR